MGFPPPEIGPTWRGSVPLYLSGRFGQSAPVLAPQARQGCAGRTGLSCHVSRTDVAKPNVLMGDTT